MNETEIKPDIYWVGAIDWAVRDFHGYVTPKGTTYNNYLILDKETTLIDTVKYDFADITIRSIKKLAGPSGIKNIIINHIENDHMSALGRVMEHFPQAVIYCTLRGKQGMERFFDISKWNIKTVKTGDSLNIGKHTLMFLETPMLHWPDSMMTYVKEAKVLFSQDAFGQHIATTQRFDDEYIESSSINELEAITIDYYANILMPFGRLIKSKIAEIVKLNMEIDIIAPDHGLIWRKSPEMAIDIYLKMADGHAKLRVALIYDTMWHSTEQMTLPLIQGIREEGVECKVIKLRATPMSAAITEFWNSRGCLVGSPTLNNEVFPSVAEFIVHLRGLRPKDRMVGAFGSYGWGGGAVKWLYNEFDVMKLKSVPEGVQVNYRASDEDEIRCFEFGREFARNVKEYHRQFK